MQSVSPQARRYDGLTIVFHWITALLIVGQFAGAWTIDLFPRGAWRVDARSVHITFGVTLALLLAARLLWRATRGRRLPLADTGALNVVARGTHWGLYALVVSMVTVGAVLTWTRGDSIFNLFSIPATAPSPTRSRRCTQ